METRAHRPIWTIGHSSMAIDEFIGLLQKSEIDLVVDVRTAPYSRFANQFNKPDLTYALERAGIDYRYEGQRLGGRPNDPTCYRNEEIPDHAERADFLKLVDYEAVAQKDWFRQALTKVIDDSARHNVALVCSEEDPFECNRHRLIASALDERGIEVIHIRRRGNSARAVFAKQPVLEQVSLF